MVDAKGFSSDPRQEKIMAAAVTVFAAYGYRRTSMEDIAKAAGMSRPALYQYFRNKQDVFRSLIAWFYKAVTEQLEQALAQEHTVDGGLRAIFGALSGPMIEAVLDSPHGEEIFGEGLSENADICSQGEAAKVTVLARWLQERLDAGQASLPSSAEDTARLILALIAGIKKPPYAEYVRRCDQLASLLAVGLSPRR